MNRFRLRQLETVLGRGPRRELCQDCGGLSMETIFRAMLVVDRDATGDRAQAQRILDELEGQPRTCIICNSLTSSGELQAMDDLERRDHADETKTPHH